MRICVFFIILVGLSIIFNCNFFDITINMISNIMMKRKAKEISDVEEKRIYILGYQSAYEAKKAQIEETLKRSGIKCDFNKFFVICILSGVIGFIVGAILSNMYLAIIMCIGFCYIPMLYITLKQNTYNKIVSDMLEGALNSITTTYIQSGDIIRAIERVLDRIPQPLAGVFIEFLAETRFVNSNVVNAINNIKAKIDNQYYKQWCDTLIQCQFDENIKYSLPSIIEKMSDLKRMQNEFDTMILDVYKNFISVISLGLIFLLMIYFMQRDWFIILFTTTPGKITIAINAGIILIGTIIIVKINSPINLL